MKRGSVLKAVMCVCFAVLICTAMTSCGVKVSADISAYGDTPIKVTGLEKDTFEVTPNELAKMECVKETAEGVSKKAGKVTAVGPTLETFTKEHGHEVSEYSQITFKASDGYTTVLDSAFLKSHSTIVLSVANGDKALRKKEQPMRLLIPGAPSSKWTKLVKEIDYEK